MATKPADGKFSLSYFLNGEGPKDWWRSYGDAVRVAITLVVIFAIIFTIKNLFFSKPQGNVNKPEAKQSVTATPFSKVGDISQSFTSTSEQKVENKRAWWMPIPYISVFGEVRGEASDLNQRDFGWGGQVGVRWDF
jgi:hypothetical protein